MFFETPFHGNHCGSIVSRITSSDFLSKVSICKSNVQLKLCFAEISIDECSYFLTGIDMSKSELAGNVEIICVLGVHILGNHCVTRHLRHMCSYFLRKHFVFEDLCWPLAASRAAESRGESVESPRRVWGDTVGVVG